jgi:hypothetical protein
MQQAITDRIKESPDFLANVLSMLENFQPNVNQKIFTMTILETYPAGNERRASEVCHGYP